MCDQMQQENQKEMTFEEAMAKLEGISDAMSKEGLPLEESMKLYGEGVELIRFCTAKLEQVERTIQALDCNQDGELVKTEFPAEPF